MVGSEVVVAVRPESMRLGEGSGAVLAVPVVRSAVAALLGIAQLSDLA